MREKVICVLAFCMVLIAGNAFADFTTINRMDDAGNYYAATQLMDIDGSNIVGWAEDAGHNHYGFLYNGGNFTDLSRPVDSSSPNGYGLLSPHGVDGENIVGTQLDLEISQQNGFLYSISQQTWATVDIRGKVPGTVVDMELLGISGSNMVGSYWTLPNYAARGFLYNSGTDSWSTLDAIIDGVSSTSTRLAGISGNTAVGFADGYRGFIYDISSQSFTGLFNAEITTMQPRGINGDDVVGSCIINDDGIWRGFLYNMISGAWTIYEKPDAYNLYPFGIYGDTIVGYSTASPAQGFIYQIPEPGTLVLLVLAGLMLAGKILIKRKHI